MGQVLAVSETRKWRRKKVVGRKILPKQMNSFQVNLLHESKGKRRNT